jgi:hypothetical protein
MHSTRSWLIGALLVVAAGSLGPPEAAARASCDAYLERRVARFGELADRAIRQCAQRQARRGTDCPDARLARRLEGLRLRTSGAIERRCAVAGIGSRLAAIQAELLCSGLELCAPSRVALTVVTSDAEGRLRAALDARVPAAGERSLAVDAGWSGNAHDLQILEGAGFVADLTACDGSDTLCDLDAAVAGTRFGAPSPISAGGVAVCLPIEFASDVRGSLDRASGDVNMSTTMLIGVSPGLGVDQPCPACVPADGDPELGESGTCDGGPGHGAPCVVEALADPGFGAKRGSSNACALPVAIAEFTSDVTATTGAVELATTAASPQCGASGFTDQRCLCDTCNTAGFVPCRSDADCPASGGVPGTCGGLRCLTGPKEGLPCATLADCEDAPCGKTGEPTRPNACADGVCTPAADGSGAGICLAGPLDGRCDAQPHRACIVDLDCPLAGDTCTFAARTCLPDPIGMTGTPDSPVETALPTLVGAFCLAPTESPAVNAAAGFPGPTRFVWPTNLRFE